MRDAVLVYFQLPPRMFKTFGAAPRGGAARVRPFPKFFHAREPFQRCRRVLRAERSPAAHKAAKTNATKMVTCWPVTSNSGFSTDLRRFRLGRPTCRVTALIPRLVLGIGQSWLAYEIESDAVTSHTLYRDKCACAI